MFTRWTNHVPVDKKTRKEINHIKADKAAENSPKFNLGLGFDAESKHPRRKIVDVGQTFANGQQSHVPMDKTHSKIVGFSLCLAGKIRPKTYLA